MPNNQDGQDLSECTVAIRGSKDSKILGTGVVVADDGLILSCYHVVGDIKKNVLDESVDIYFPSAPNIKGHAQPIKKYCNPELDIAFLQLQTKLPEQTRPAILSESIIRLHNYQSLGFRESDKVKGGLYTAGKIQGRTFEKSKSPLQRIVQLTVDHNRSKVPHGMSGAPVLDTNQNKVIGIISASLHSETHDFAIPIESIVKAYSKLRDKNPGLTRINKFLTKLSDLSNDWYYKLDSLYVHPNNYKEIIEKLRNNNIIFIIGSPEYGKTYTAIKILWEYYSINNYEPIYIPYKSNKSNSKGIDRFVEIQNEAKSHHIICFDDLLGNEKYEPNEQLEGHIGEIIDIIRSSDDCYVIITSREEVFKEFHPLDGTELKDLECKLNMKTTPYDYDKKKQLLTNYASAIDCTNLIAEDNLKTVLRYLKKNENKLAFPLSIREFVFAVKARNPIGDKKLISLIDEKSKAGANRFARELGIMKPEKVAFLSLLYISQWISVEDAKKMYHQLIEELGIKDNSLYFDTVLNSFKDDKINVSRIYKEISFSHDVYLDAIDYILSDINYTIEVRRILFKAVRTVSNYGYVSDVLTFLHKNFSRLPEDLKYDASLNASRISSLYVFQFLISHFDVISDRLKELLYSLIRNTKEDDMYFFAQSIGSNYSKLPPDITNILFDISIRDHYEDYNAIADTLLYSFEGLPNKIKIILFLKHVNNMSLYHGYGFAKLFGKLALFINNYFDEIPEKERTMALLKLIDKQDYRTQTLGYQEEARKYIIMIKDNHSKKLPTKILHEL